jgi:hypothetical protein
MLEPYQPEEPAFLLWMSRDLRMGGWRVESGVVRRTSEFEREVRMGHAEVVMWGVEEAPSVAGPRVLDKASQWRYLAWRILPRA